MKLAGTTQPHEFVLGIAAMATAGGRHAERAKNLLQAAIRPLSELRQQMVLAVDVVDVDKRGRRTRVIRLQDAGQAKAPNQLIAVIELPRKGKATVTHRKATPAEVLDVIQRGAYAGLTPH